MEKHKLKFKRRRALLRSDFRKTPRRKVPTGLIFVKDGCINTNEINSSFPNKVEQLAYLQALVIGMGGSLE